jgi:drug/metabolite transporter (DMT)-like permease
LFPLNPSGSFPVGLAFTLGAVFLWGTQVPVAKVLLESMDSFAFGALRYLIALAGFAPILWWREGWRGFSAGGQGGRLAVAGGIGLAGSTVLVFLGLSFTRAESAAIILALQPGMTALAQWVIDRRRPPAYTLACLAIAFVGVLMVITRGGAAFSSGAPLEWREWIGNLLVLCGSMAWVTYVISAAPLATWSAARLSTLGSAWAALVLTLVWVIAASLGYADRSIHLDADDSARLAYVSVFGAMAAMFWWNAGVRRIGALNAALFGYLMPVFAFALRALEGAVFTGAEIAGVVLVIVSLAANNLIERQRRHRRPG